MIDFSVEISDRAPVFLNKQLEGLYNKIKKNPKDYLSHRQYAEILLERPNKERALRAIQSLEIILSEKECDIDSQVLYLIALRYTDKMKKAKNLVERLIEEYPNTVGFHVQLIQILHIENKIDQAEDLLKTALKKFPYDEHLVRLHIRLQNSLKKWEKSLTLCNSVLQSHPKDQRIVISKCQSLFFLDRVDELILFFEKFKDEHPHQFNLPMWSMDDEYFSCSSVYALFCKIAANRKSPEHQNTHIENEQLVIVSELTENSKNLLEKAIDETTEILSNTQYHTTQNEIKLLQAECYRIFEKFQESSIILKEIPSEYKFRNTGMEKILTLFYSKEFQKCIEFCSTYLDSFPDDIVAKGAVSYSYLGLGNTSEFEKRMSELKDRVKDTKTYKQVNAGFHIYPKQHFQNDQKFIDFLCSFSGVLCISNAYTKVDIVDYIERAITHYDCKVKTIRILSGPFNRIDGGDQFYTVYKELKKKITFFNQKGAYPCKIKIKIKMNYDEHARYYFDEKSVYNGTGTDQVIDGQKDDFNPEYDPTTIEDIKKDFQDNWIDESNYELTDQNWHNLLRAYGKKYKKPFCESIENELDSDKK